MDHLQMRTMKVPWEYGPCQYKDCVSTDLDSADQLSTDRSAYTLMHSFLL